MRFTIAAVILILGVSSAQARTEMILFVSNHLGFRKQDRVLIEKSQKIFYNDIEIPKKLIPKIQKPLASLKQMPKEKRRFCYENQYTYTLIDKKVKKELHACAEGAEFARLAGAFLEIQQLILKNGN